MSLFKKLLLVGVLSAVVSLGVAGIGTASAHDPDHDWDHPCIADGTHAVDPACWQGVIWGGVGRGWIPQAGYYNNAAGNFWQVYYFLNFYNPYGYWFNGAWYNNAYNPYYNNGYAGHPCNNGQNGFWDAGYWHSCAAAGYWSNGLWYPYWN